ncbi:MAG: hypothetical protein HQM10_22605 [Candidatus Riflebacteria bacterium]|nr:hypothetical protein [Candidatus Riflebacteria bacterium]
MIIFSEHYIIADMKKALCLIQVISIIATIFVTHCIHCPTSTTSDNLVIISQVSSDSCDETHHSCHSINCSCGLHAIPATQNMTFDLIISDDIAFQPPEQLLSNFLPEIFQPPRIAKL